MLGIEAILFDNDGVLVHTEQVWFETNQAVLRSMGVEYAASDFIRHTFEEGWGSKGWLKRKGYSDAFIAEFSVNRAEAFTAAMSERDVTDPSAHGVLTALKDSFRLGIVTNTEREFFATLHARNALLAMIEVLVLREDYVRTKPAPDAYLAGLKKLNLPPDRVLVVEDSPRGIRSAQAAGIKVAGIANPAFPDVDISQADYRLGSLNDLPELVERI